MDVTIPRRRDFNNDILRGVQRRRPDLDIVRVQDVGLAGVEDPEVLAWAADNGRILLTHDRATIPDFAYERMAAGMPMAGVFLIPPRFPVGQVILEILLLDECSEQAEWVDRVVRLPF